MLKKIYVAAIISFLTSACHENKTKFQPMIDRIKQKISAEVPNLKSIDTIYLLVRILTPQDVMSLQGIEYTWAATEAKRTGNPDSTIFDDKAYDIFVNAEHSDSTTFMYYEAAPYIIFTTKSLEKQMGDTRLYFDKQFNVIPKYSLVKKIAPTDNTKLDVQPYKPFSPEDYKELEDRKVLKYY
jgi:hypothetical protein